VQRDPDGRALRMHGLHLDITGRKQLEEALQRADRQKDQFLAMLSHELRNPLAPIRTVASILGSPRASDSQIAWSRQVIQRQVRHLSLLLDDLLDVARITQGKLSLRRSSVPLRSIVDAAIETVQSLLDEKQHRLVLEADGLDECVHVDPLRLSQVVSNLLTNAAKYTDPGGRIRLRVQVTDRELRFDVEDSGAGIPADALPRIFTMFEQLDCGGDATRGGLGIGLALVKGLVELHGGHVAAESAGPGHGSTFRVTVPLEVHANGGPAERLPQHAATAPAARKVLVADDNRDAADALAMLVGLGPHEVRVAYGGTEALRLAEEFQPDVAFLDIGMPDVSGHDVARAIRERPWSRQTCLVAITGWGQAEDKRRAQDAGFDRHLTKPVDPSQIDAILREAVARQ
jgi:CheY-like chemotaxis protein/two-component sensor histidine kinase